RGSLTAACRRLVCKRSFARIQIAWSRRADVTSETDPEWLRRSPVVQNAAMDSTSPGDAHPEDARIDESYELHKTLTEDLMMVTAAANSGDQTARRAYVRAAFALMDGMAFRMKATALAFGGASLKPGEQALLQEKEYFLNDTGGVDARKARLNTLKNFRFTFAMLSKAGKSEWSPE